MSQLPRLSFYLFFYNQDKLRDEGESDRINKWLARAVPDKDIFSIRCLAGPEITLGAYIKWVIDDMQSDQKTAIPNLEQVSCPVLYRLDEDLQPDYMAKPERLTVAGEVYRLDLIFKQPITR